MKIISWNVNGVRSIAKKDFFSIFNKINADIFCLQETKAQDHQVEETLIPIQGYYKYSNSAERKGYSGTAIITKQLPLKVTYDMGVECHDKEGRIICAEYEEFFLIDVYVPNSGADLKRLEYREEWDKDFYEYLKKIEKSKPIIVCGDFNVAHSEIDLARPKANYDKSAGYTQKEIDGMDRFTKGGLLDTFRYFYPTLENAYSWWSYRGGARQRNIGWRIDYFLVSQKYITNIKDSFILDKVTGSDHCPTGIELKS